MHLGHNDFVATKNGHIGLLDVDRGVDPCKPLIQRLFSFESNGKDFREVFLGLASGQQQIHIVLE